MHGYFFTWIAYQFDGEISRNYECKLDVVGYGRLIPTSSLHLCLNWTITNAYYFFPPIIWQPCLSPLLFQTLKTSKNLTVGGQINRDLYNAMPERMYLYGNGWGTVAIHHACMQCMCCGCVACYHHCFVWLIQNKNMNLWMTKKCEDNRNKISNVLFCVQLFQVCFSPIDRFVREPHQHR